MPIEPVGDQAGSANVTPPLGVEQDAWGGRELVESVFGALTEVYERLDAQVRAVPEAVPPVGWAPHVAALRALREGRVAGDWEVLARLLVSPGSLAQGTDQVRLVEVRDGAAEVEAVRAVVKALAAGGDRALLLAPTQERAAELLQGFEDDPEVFPLLIETRPVEEGSTGTIAAPVVEEAGAADLPVREFGAHGTVEFRPVSLPEPDEPESPSVVTRVEGLPVIPDEVGADETLPAPVVPEVGSEAPQAPEARVREVVVRPVGEAWRQSWRTEARMLQRGLMWLEQWPRDAAALESVQAEGLRRREQLEAEQAALAAGIEESEGVVAAAGRAAEEAEAEAERLAVVQAEAEAELEGPRAEAERLQAVADAAAAEAGELTRTADAAFARCAELDQRAMTAKNELDSARRLEESLVDELERARQALPAAAEEAERLAAADADAAAEGHASYYRLVSAESALSALRRKMTLGQRLHVASPPSGLNGLRAEVKARAREADEAARRAKEAKDAAERAEEHRQGIAAFVSDGGSRLATAQEAQQRLGTELAWLATEREKAGAEHREQARLAAESVDRATQASLEARGAQQAAHVIEERVNAARTSREQALAAAQRARAEAEQAASRAAEVRAALDRHVAEAAEELARRDAEQATAAEAEARSRENVREICGADPADDAELIPTHQRRAMARIEELRGFMEGGEASEAASEVLLRTADVVVGTPLGAGVAVDGEEFDALVVAGAGAVTDADFLIGAVRARRWVLIGEPGTRPVSYREYAGVDGLEHGPFERAAVAAPHLLDG
ncbi:hypothetical protein [Actinomadura fibrosa]|uniref:Uncharacterized protein n=1 Tax=Actinomadura fibrosa TaxID=111802 RepID=A0ABW2XDT9_9ACTN|nr:hypothetical protein [Actinomadura fibrosa]